MPKRSAKTSKLKDVAMVISRTEDNEGYQILRRRSEDSPVELGTVRPIREGKPMDDSAEIVRLRPRKDRPFVYDVKTELSLPRRLTSDGPPQVATDQYRQGWDAIWGRDKRTPRALN